MSIFGRNPISDSIELPLLEGYGVEVNGDLIAIQESFDDQLEIMKSIHTVEMAALNHRGVVTSLQESAAEAFEVEKKQEEYEVVVEAAIKDAFESIKKFFVNLYGKVIAFFKSVGRFFDSLIKDGADFVKKYKNDLLKADLKGFKAELYVYTNVDDYQSPEQNEEGIREIEGMAKDIIADVNSKSIEELRETVKDLKENGDEALNIVRGELVNKTNISADDYGKELFSFFRNGATKGEKKEKDINIQQIISAIESAAGCKKKVDAVIKANNEGFKRALKLVDSAKSAVKADKQLKSHDGDRRSILLETLRAYASTTSATKSITQSALRAWRAAWVERDRAYKAVCRQALNHKADK